MASADGTESVVLIAVNANRPTFEHANRAAVVSGDLAGETTEDDPAQVTTGGQLSVTDPDVGERSFQAQTATPGRYGLFTLQSGGSWSYVLDDYAADALTAGQKVADVFIVTSADGTENAVVVTVTGANDAANVFGGTAIRHASLDLSHARAPVVTLNRPLSVHEGGTLTIDAQVVPNGAQNTLFGELEWDLDRDGVFGDRTGERIALTWYELVRYGFDDDGSDHPPITVRASNMDAQGNLGLTSHTEFDLIVHNTPPEIAVQGEATANLDTPYTIFFEAFDPGDDTIHRWRIDWGDSTSEEFGAGATSAQHTYRELGPESIQVTAIDEDGETLAPAHTVTVIVVDAQIDAGGPYTILEGEDLVLHTSVPGSPSAHYVLYGTRPIQGLVAGPRESDTVTVPWETLAKAGLGNDGAHTLTYAVLYSNGSSASKDFTLNIWNVGPEASLELSATSVDEGGEIEIVVRASDASTADRLGYYFDFDNDGDFDGQDLSGNTETRVTYTFPDDAERHVIRVMVSDGDGAATEVFGVVTVNEVAPTLIVEPVSGALASTEGDEFSVRVDATDPGDDTVSHWVVDWGDGSPRTTHEGSPHTLVHRFRRSGPTTIQFWAYDEDGIYRTSKSVTVSNVAPTLADVTVTPAAEGARTRLSGTFSDPGAEESFELAVDWGDGTRETHRLDGEADEFDLGHVYANDGTYAAVVTLSDPDAAQDTVQANVAVANAVPEISLNADRAALREGSAVTVFGTVTDPGIEDTHSVSIDWGDGTAATAVAVDPATRYYSATHVYRDDAGSPFTVTATVTDSGDATGQASLALQVENVGPEFEYFYASRVDEVAHPPARVNAVWDDAQFTTGIDRDEDGTVSVTVTGSYSGYDAEVGIVRVSWGDDTATRAVLDKDAETFTATATFADYTSEIADDIAILMSTPQIRMEETSRVTVTGRVRDPGADVVTVRIAWGDYDTEEVAVDPATGEFTATHTYRAHTGETGVQPDTSVLEVPIPGDASPPVFYYIAAVASDGAGAEHSSTIALEIERPPEFTQARYAFDLSENRDGSGTPVELGAVEALDPNREDALIYGISDGSSDFAIDPATGILRYVGSGEDFETAPASYELTVSASDPTGRSDRATVAVSITDVDEAARIGGDLTGAVAEDADETTASGRLTVDDPDAGQDSFRAQTDAEGIYGTFTLNRDGSWTYTLDNADPDTDALTEGEIAADSFTVASADGTTARVDIAVTGVDDMPEVVDPIVAVVPGDDPSIGGALTGAVTEDADETTATGRLELRDPDTQLTEAQRRFTAQTGMEGTYGSFTLRADGSWTYTLDNADPDTDALAVGRTGRDSFTVAGGGVTAEVVIAVTGADDPAEIAGDLTGAVTEGAAVSTASGRLEVRDVDTPLTATQRQFTPRTDVAGTYGTFTLQQDGSWIFQLDNDDPNTHALPEGMSVTDSFAVASAGGVTGRVVITVTGTDDEAEIAGALAGEVTEDAEETTAGGRLTVRDPDAGEASFRPQTGVAGTYGTFTLKRARLLDLHARQRGPGHRRADRGPGGHGRLHGDQRRRHGGAGRDHGDGGRTTWPRSAARSPAR